MNHSLRRLAVLRRPGKHRGLAPSVLGSVLRAAVVWAALLTFAIGLLAVVLQSIATAAAPEESEMPPAQEQETAEPDTSGCTEDASLADS